MTLEQEEKMLLKGLVIFFLVVFVGVRLVLYFEYQRTLEDRRQQYQSRMEYVVDNLQKHGTGFSPTFSSDLAAESMEQELDRKVLELRQKFQAIRQAIANENEDQAPVADSLPCPSAPDNQ